MVELVVVIALTGIISAIVAKFIQVPMQGYIDMARRAELSDIADTAIRRVSRDLRSALPNSVRITTSGSSVYIEFLPILTGGRYRADVNNVGAGDPLDFSSTTETSFDMFGPVSMQPGQALAAATNYVVVYNLGIAGADAYNANAGSSDNTSPLTGAAAAGSLTNENKFNFTAKKFPFPSPSNRFQIIDRPVTYVCTEDATGASGTLRRYSGYAIQASQPVSISVAPLSTATSALLAENVSNCDFTYQTGVTERTGLVTLLLGLTKDSETVQLYSSIHVGNVP